MIKLIIFDFDGVIVSGSNQGYFDCYHKSLVSVGVSLDPGEEKRRILERWGQDHRLEISLLLKEHPEKVDEAVKVYEENISKLVYNNNVSLIYGVREVLESLSKKYTLAIASGADRESIEKMIKKFDLNFFKKIISGYELLDSSHHKPSPYMIEVLLKEFNVTKDETIMVGDALTDVQMAQNAGVTPIVVLTGHLTREEAEENNVKYIIKSVKDIESVLASSFSY